jgi:glycosyltransferase involved in cell wall biosynthesis
VTSPARPARSDAGPVTGGTGPRVAVIIPTHDRSRVLVEAIASALAQTFRDLEIVVVDDGSTDDTAEVLRTRFGSEPRVRRLRQERAGPAAARNRGIRASVSELVAFLDSDDLWLADKLALQVARLDAEPSAPFCFCDRVLDARTLSGSRFRAKGFAGDTTLRGMVAKDFPLSTPSVVIRRAVLDRIGPFDESLAGAEDWDLWIRALATGPACVVDRPLTVVGVQPDSLSRTGALAKWSAMLRLWEKHETLLLRAGCSRRLLAGRRARAHRRLARALGAEGRHAEAAAQALAWWRCRPWDPWPLLVSAGWRMRGGSAR